MDVDAICDISGGRLCPNDSACQGSESMNDQDQVLVGDRTCQVKLSAIDFRPSQTTAKRNSTQGLIHMDGHISTQVQLDAEGSSNIMTDTCMVQGQTIQPCTLLSASLSGCLLPAQQHEDNGTAALPPQQCMTSLAHIGKASMQHLYSQRQGSDDNITVSKLNAGISDLAGASAAISMVGRMVSAAAGCFCT